MSLASKSLMSCRTFTKGSLAARAAIEASMELFMEPACFVRNAAARSCEVAPGASSAPRSCSNCMPLNDDCARAAGRCTSAAPDTLGLEMISIALARASSSSWRSFCRWSNSTDFVLQFARRSARYFSSAALAVCVSSKSPFAAASAACSSPRCSVLRLVSSSAYLTSSVSVSMTSSKACRRFISSFSNTFFSSWNLSLMFSKVSTILLD
mmetsp:Transcript_125212/g.362295  ORF Transcript_125212/g.362295 Transcript_125212/m.362295 type:complete len:210 (-) Transcript_125212:590-1219(-)